MIYEDKQCEYLGLQALRVILQPAGGKQALEAVARGKSKCRKPSLPRAPAVEPLPKRARASAPLPSVSVDLRGAAVEELPPLQDGQHRILGHTLSVKAAQERSLITKEWSLQKEKRWAQVLTPGVDNEAVVEALRVYLRLEKGAESRAALPSDPKLHRVLEAFTVEASDSRVGLRGQKGVRVRPDTRRPIPANAILGPYRALQLTHDEWVSNGSPDGSVGYKYDHRRLPTSSQLAAGSRALQCELLHETYAAECTAWNVQPERPQLVSSAFGYGNFLCLANDSAGPGDGGVPSRGSNVQFVEVLVHGWPMVFALTTENVAPGQELLVEYGEGYWNMVRNLMLRIQQAAAVAAAAAQQGGGAVSGGGSVQPGHLLERLPSVGELSRPS